MKATNINFTALDVGSSKISLLAASVDYSGDARIGYQGIFKSSGIKGGIINDYKKAENSIINAIYHLEKSIDRNISSVSISISGVGVKSSYIYQKIRLLDGKVTSGDIKLLSVKALEQFDSKQYTVLHYFPIEYTLDQNNSINNPVGMFGNILGCRLHVVTADTGQINNLINCFSKCHINVKEITIGSYASSLAVLTDDEKSLGSVVIDFGSNTTSFAIFSASQLIYTGFIPIGGDHITGDIAKILSIGVDSAEKLKVMYGSALSSNRDSENIINLSEIEPGINHDFDGNITANDLSMIISARAEEIIELLKAEYDKVGVDHLIGRRIVLTGGGAQLRGIKEIVSSTFNKQVRIGQPLNIPGFENDHTTPSFCSTLGLIKSEMLKQKKKSNLGMSSSNILQKISSWLQDPI